MYEHEKHNEYPGNGHEISTSYASFFMNDTQQLLQKALCSFRYNLHLSVITVSEKGVL